MSDRPTYSVRFEPPAWKALMSLPVRLQERILSAIEALEIEPRPAGVEKMKGEDYSYRIRVGDYRIIYEIHDNVLLVMVFTIGNRKEVYRKR